MNDDDKTSSEDEWSSEYDDDNENEKFYRKPIRY